jgi:hypothetical protein
LMLITTCADVTLTPPSESLSRKAAGYLISRTSPP